jgi:hypothetical protein
VQKLGRYFCPKGERDAAIVLAPAHCVLVLRKIEFSLKRDRLVQLGTDYTMNP